MNKRKTILPLTALLLVVFSISGFIFRNNLPENSHVQSVSSKKNKKDSITWYSMDEGYDLAVKKKKILVVDVYTDWCGYCKIMDSETYGDSTVIEKMNQYCIAVKFNPEINKTYIIKGDTMNSSQLLRYLNKGGRNPGYPMTFIWKNLKDQTKIAPYTGYIEKSIFHDFLNKYIQQ